MTTTIKPIKLHANANCFILKHVSEVKQHIYTHQTT